MDVYQFPFGGQYAYTTGVDRARHEHRCRIKDFLGLKYPMLTLDVVFIYMFSSLSGRARPGEYHPARATAFEHPKKDLSTTKHWVLQSSGYILRSLLPPQSTRAPTPRYQSC